MIINRLIILLALAAIVIGCSEKEESGTTEEYVGTYYANDDSTTLLHTTGFLTDSVVLIVRSNLNYSMLFYNYDPNDPQEKNYCNCEGTVDGFGSNLTTFYPIAVDSGNCDKIRIPSGSFVSDYISYGDTVYMTQSGTIDSLPNSTFKIKLLK